MQVPAPAVQGQVLHYGARVRVAQGQLLVTEYRASLESRLEDPYFEAPPELGEEGFVVVLISGDVPFANLDDG